MSILIQEAVVDGKVTDILIEGNRYKSIAPGITAKADETIRCGASMALVPAFYNMHTHSAMTLLRGYADDMELFTWLNKHIWPIEGRMTPEDIYAGARLAIVEMLKSGTVFFNDSYWRPVQTAKAAIEMGLRAAIGRFSCGKEENTREANQELDEMSKDFPERIQITLDPHSVYTQDETQLRAIGEDFQVRNLFLHIHASETKQEVENCLKTYGRTPIALLKDAGCLGPKAILAHCVHLTPEDIDILRETQTILVHNPVSNMKLCSGLFDLRATADQGGCRVTLGTDGCASNNNLSMFDEMKAAALTAKARTMEPTAAPASQIFALATRNGAEAFGLKAGLIKEGYLADGILVNLEAPALASRHNLISDLVYAADTSVVDTVFCDGRILVRHGHVEGEEEIIAKAQEAIRRLCGR